jgi:hypothetical protein
MDTVTAIEKSNMSNAAKKNALERWWDGFRVDGSGRVKRLAMSGAEVARQGAESFATGAALGALDSALDTGLDKQVKLGSKPDAKVVTVPIDGVLAVMGIGASIMMAGSSDTTAQEFSRDARNVGVAALTVFGFREGRQYIAVKMREAHKVPGYQKTPQYLAAQGGSSPVRGEFSMFAGDSTRDPIEVIGDEF